MYFLNNLGLVLCLHYCDFLGYLISLIQRNASTRKLHTCPGSRIHSKSMYGMTDIRKTWISICEYLLFTNIHWEMSLHGYPCLDINVDIHACMDN